jgi:sarcosine oxidase, subunit alpha
MPNDMRLKKHPFLTDEQGKRHWVSITVDGRPLAALEGESLAAALWAGGYIALRHDHGSDTFRGMYCGIGHCSECRVSVDGIPDVRSCLVLVRNGMRVSLQDADPADQAHGRI